MRKPVLIVSVLATAELVALLLLWRSNQVIKRTNQSLQAEIAELKAANQATATAARPDEKLTADFETQKRELMRLRNEVTQLRANREAGARAEAEKAHARAAQVPAPPSPELASAAGRSIPRDEWKFAGYNTPEAAFISGMSAMKDGQLATVLNSFTPEEQGRLQSQGQFQTDAEVAQRFQKEYGNVTGVRVLGSQETAPGEVVLDVYLEGVGAMKKYHMAQVGSEWKASGPVNQNASPATSSDGADPLAFYRRNPELMKRYFPQLYKAEQAQAPQATQATEPPPQGQ